MSTETNLSALTVGELVQSFVDTIQFRKTIEHVGRRIRLFHQIWDIAVELKARDPTLNCLRGLLDHPSREVRFDAAAEFKNIDRAVFKKILGDLTKGKDRVGFDARMCRASRQPKSCRHRGCWRSSPIMMLSTALTFTGKRCYGAAARKLHPSSLM